LRYVHFPTTCIISLLYVLEDGASAEIAIVGNEGILGIPARLDRKLFATTIWLLMRYRKIMPGYVRCRTEVFPLLVYS